MSAQGTLPAKGRRTSNKSKEVFEVFETPAGTTEDIKEEEATKVPLPTAQSSEDEDQDARGSQDARVPKQLFKEVVEEDRMEDATDGEDGKDGDVVKPRLTSRKSIGRYTPRSVPRSIKSKLKIADRRLVARY